MLYGTVPFKANNMAELQNLILTSDLTLAEGISKEAKDLLTRILDKNPASRISVEGILQHAWMRDAKERVELFTGAEKNYMLASVLNWESEDDPLQQTLDPQMRNQETKSVILAPFNSTKSNLEELEKHYTLPPEIRCMIQSKSCLKFA